MKPFGRVITAGALSLALTTSAFAATAHQQPAPTRWVLMEFDATPDASGQPAIVLGLTNKASLDACNSDVKVLKEKNSTYSRWYRCWRMTPAASNRGDDE